MMNERRKQRSECKDEALALLLESVRARSSISAIALVDGRGSVVAGAGPERDLRVLGAVARPAAAGPWGSACEKLTAGTDVLACRLATRDGPMYLAALGDRVSRMPEAARSVTRILQA